MNWIEWQFGKPRYRSQPKQWYIWLLGIFLEWNADGFELSYYRSPGELCLWKWTVTKSGKPIQDDSAYRTGTNA